MNNNKKSPRGVKLRPDGKHVSALQDSESTTGFEFLDDIESVSEDLNLDAEELISRGVLSLQGHNPDDGQIFLESQTGINKNKEWTQGIHEKNNPIRGDYIYVSRETVPYLKALFAGRSPRSQRHLWREMLWLFGKTRTALIEVRNPGKRKTWFGVFSAADVSLGNEKLLYLICSDLGNGMSYDFSSQGVGGFELHFVGAFKSVESCLDYRDFLINCRLDKGWGSYNIRELESGTVKRWVSVELPFELVTKLGSACVRKGLKVKTVVEKLVRVFLRKQESVSSSSPDDL